MPATEEPPLVPIASFDASVQKSPDGNVWTVLHINTAQISVAAVFSIAQAEKLRDGLPELLAQCIAEAKREARGLTIASADALDLLKGDRK